MIITLSKILALVFCSLACIHFYWAAGGLWGFSSALPTNELGVRVLNPTPFQSLIVGIGLLAFGLFYLSLTNILSLAFPSMLNTVLYWFIPTVFLLRALGDFNYVGFFKTVKTTEFANMDYWVYSPLCLAIAVMGFVIIRLR